MTKLSAQQKAANTRKANQLNKEIEQAQANGTHFTELPEVIKPEISKLDNLQVLALNVSKLNDFEVSLEKQVIQHVNLKANVFDSFIAYVIESINNKRTKLECVDLLGSLSPEMLKSIKQADGRHAKLSSIVVFAADGIRINKNAIKSLAIETSLKVAYQIYNPYSRKTHELDNQEELKEFEEQAKKENTSPDSVTNKDGETLSGKKPAAKKTDRQKAETKLQAFQKFLTETLELKSENVSSDTLIALRTSLKDLESQLSAHYDRLDKANHTGEKLGDVSYDEALAGKQQDSKAA